MQKPKPKLTMDSLISIINGEGHAMNAPGARDGICGYCMYEVQKILGLSRPKVQKLIRAGIESGHIKVITSKRMYVTGVLRDSNAFIFSPEICKKLSDSLGVKIEHGDPSEWNTNLNG